MRRIREKIQNVRDTDKALKNVLEQWQYEKYQNEFSSSSTSGQMSHQNDSSSDDEQPSPVVPSRETSYQRDSRSSYESLEAIGGDRYFPERYRYASKIKPFYGKTSKGCVINATMMILHAQGIRPIEDKLVQHVQYFDCEPGDGFSIASVPPALQALGSASYTCRKISSVNDLQTIIDTSDLPATACIQNTGRLHMVLVEKIEDHATHGKLICIINWGESYKVTKKDWEAVWRRDEDVVGASTGFSQVGTNSPQVPQPFSPYDPYSQGSYGPYRYW
jgi:hypothetical protein